MNQCLHFRHTPIRPNTRLSSIHHLPKTFLTVHYRDRDSFLLLHHQKYIRKYLRVTYLRLTRKLDMSITRSPIMLLAKFAVQTQTQTQSLGGVHKHSEAYVYVDLHSFWMAPSEKFFPVFCPDLVIAVSSLPELGAVFVHCWANFRTFIALDIW